MQFELRLGRHAVRASATAVTSVVVRPAVYVHLSAKTVKKGRRVTLYGEVKNFRAGQTVTRELLLLAAPGTSWNSTKVDARASTRSRSR